jgi:outer membrane protein assembly factor BamB
MGIGQGGNTRVTKLASRLAIGFTLIGALGTTGLVDAAAKKAQPQAQPQTQQDWPTYLHDVARSSASGETILNTANVPYLQSTWNFVTGGVVASSPAVVGTGLYAGSWDGNEYRLNAATGALVWKTAIGITNDPACHPPTIGVTSSAAVVNGIVYVGGGDAYWYALNATNGAVLWKVFTGDNSQAGAHYNWSSPLIVGNFGYIGVASNCDAPLVQGQLLKVDLTSHQIVATANFVPNGQLGGGVWTSPTYDAATNTVFVSTGTLNLYSQTLSQAIVSLDANTLAIKDHWQLPFEAAVSDSDWGTTPTLTTDSNNRQLLSIANKNGVLYTLRRNNLAAGPIWQKQIAVGGDCPVCGDGSIASGAFAGGVLYYAGGSNVDANGIGHGGSVTAFDPGTGNLLWYHGTDGPIIGSIAYDNGVIFDPQGQTMEALDAATGRSIWDYRLAAPMYAAPAISNGVVYLGGVDGKVHAFGLPNPLPPPPPTDANCPAGFTCQDIGPVTAGSEHVNNNGSVTVNGYGKGARLQADEMRFISEPATGDFQIGVEDVNQTGGVYPQGTGLAPQIGIMIRESSAPGSPYYAALQDPTYPNENETVANLIMFYRDTWNAPTIELTQAFPNAFPRWVMVQRHGDTFQTLVSGDGVHYTLISGTVHTVIMSTTLMAGVGVASGGSNAQSVGTYQNFTLGANTQAYAPQNTVHPCPAPWSCNDIGAGSPIGDQTLANGVWTLQGGGNGIAGTLDQLHFVNQKLGGDGTVTARLLTLANGTAASQAALLMRADASSGTTYYGVVVKPNGTATLQWRQYNGVKNRTTIALDGTTFPKWFQVSRYTDTTRTPKLTYYSLLTSTDGTTWTEVNGSTVALDLGANPLAGIGGSNAGPGIQNKSTWDNLAISNQRIQPPGVCPAGYTCQDVGVGYDAGSQLYNNNTWTFAAGGQDIWDVYDTFHYVYQPLAADGTISARVIAVTAPKPAYDTQWQKSGVMVRATTDPQSPYYGVFATPLHGIAVQWRTSQAAATNQIVIPSPNPKYPVYLMVGRWTDPHPGGQTYYTAYTATNNTNFVAVPGSTIALNLPGSLLAGIAADSFAQQRTLQITFDSFALFDTEPAPPGACPAAVAGCADIGGALPGGTQTLNGTTLTVSAGGGDIWGAADQFHYVWQSLPADGTVVARVAAQQNTGAWARAGVMLRATTDPGSPYYAIFVTPNNGVSAQYRSTQGGATSQILLAGAVPVYLEVTRYTDSGGTTYYTAYTSADGTTWTQVPKSTMSFSMPGALLAGWAADANQQVTATAVTFDHIAVSNSAPVPAGLCPVAWTCTDVGNVAPQGSQNVTGGTWTVQAGGGDIWGASDELRYLSTPMSADGTISAQVTSQQAVDPWSKAGVMMRASNNDASAPYYAVLLTPGHGVVVQWRATEASQTSQLQLAGTAPVYVRVARWTDTSGATPITYYSALTSPDGTTWTYVPRSAVALTLPANFVAGLAVASHNDTALSQVVFNAVALANGSTEPPDVCPAIYSCYDVGAATPSGTEALLNGTWSVSGGGGDTWGTADQFRFVSQALAGDGVATAHLVSLGNTDPWSKAGLMIRTTIDPGAAYYAILQTPAHGLVIQYRTTQGAATNQIAVNAAGTAPIYIRITRTGTTFSASTSTDGATWTPVAGSSVDIAALSGSLLSGMVTCSHNTGQLITASFDTVTLY